MRLQGKVALITGASRGIGRAITKCFSKEGAKVAINYNKSDEEAFNLFEELKKEGLDVILVKADISQLDEVKRMVSIVVDKFRRIDILVNNAGITIRKHFLESTEEMWDKILDVNLKGPFLCSREVAPIMLNQKRGKIINISSISGLAEKNAMINVPYSTSKAGLIGLTRSLAVNLGPDIIVNTVCPGPIDTDMFADLTPERKRSHIEASILKRIGSPEEVAKAVLFLASDDSDFITGEIITVSGGGGMR